MVSCCYREDGFPYASVTPLCANAAAEEEQQLLPTEVH